MLIKINCTDEFNVSEHFLLSQHKLFFFVRCERASFVTIKFYSMEHKCQFIYYTSLIYFRTGILNAARIHLVTLCGMRSVFKFILTLAKQQMTECLKTKTLQTVKDLCIMFNCHKTIIYIKIINFMVNS